MPFVQSFQSYFFFYVLDLKPAGYKGASFFQCNKTLGWEHVPAAKGVLYRYNDGKKFSISINEAGFSDIHRNIAKKRPRIALIGNSTAEFWEMMEDERPHFLIEENLKGRYEVLNFGVRGYGTDQTLLLLIQKVLEYKPDVVVYNFCINDVFNNIDKEAKPYFLRDSLSSKLILKGVPVSANQCAESFNADNSAKNFESRLRDLSFIYRRIRALVKTFYHPLVPIAQNFDVQPYLIKKPIMYQNAVDLTLALVDSMKTKVEESGGKFLIVQGAFRAEIDSNFQKKLEKVYGKVFDFNFIEDRFSDFASQKNINFISLSAYFRESSHSPKKIFHVEDNLHLNSYGAKIYSQVVSNWVQQNFIKEVLHK